MVLICLGNRAMDDAGHDENPLGLREGTLRLMPYRSEWPVLYRQEAARIAEATSPDSIVELHHIGSTAVEGLAAKPILDIALVVKPNAENEIASTLVALGYVERGERSGRHFILYATERVRIHNLHLYRPDDDRLRKQIAFRDLLRRDPRARAEYAKLKASLINGARQDYTPAKTDFIATCMGPLTPSRVRVILLSPKGRILLIRYRNTGPSGVDRPCWTTAGGGMEAGESVSDTALRELQEETGISDVSLGPVVWYGEDSERGSDWGVTFKEHFIVAHSKNEDVRKDGWTEHEHQQILEMRWWSIQEISDSCDLIYPNGLDELLTPILAGEYPTELKIISAPLLLNPQPQTHTPNR